MRLLGVVYLIAFVSWWVQLGGLSGSRGITPTAMTLEFLQNQLGLETFADYATQVPTLLWFDSSDRTLHGICAAGVILSLLVVARVCVGPALVLLWAAYLSLCAADAVFLGFQWENLLLETGFLAIFWASWRPWPRLKTDSEPGWAGRWLLYWLLFRLMLSSGVVKLLSGDAVWLDFTALQYHYWTQCIPTPLAWTFHQFPLWFQKFSCAAMFAVEVGAPFLIFFPRRPRMFGGLLIVLLMAAIAVTGNYNYFNLLAVVLCIPLFDDRALRRLWPWRSCPESDAGTSSAATETELDHDGHRRPVRIAWRWTAFGLTAVFVLTIATAGGVQMWRRWGQLIPPGTTFLGVEFRSVPKPLVDAVERVRPFRSVNSYGLFTNMTERRPELIIEGSDDGQTWHTYAFKYKVGDVNRAPPWVAPHQPRLDWQMWFEALRAERVVGRSGNRRAEPNWWFRQFLSRLLEGEPAVLALLKSNPFPDEPPRFVRAELYQYNFTTREEKAETGAWWSRTHVGRYVLMRRSGPGGE